MINDDSSRTCGDDGMWSPSSQPNCVGECPCKLLLEHIVDVHGHFKLFSLFAIIIFN